MGSTTIPSLQLPALTPLEPLTTGTNLPQVLASEIDSPPRTDQQPEKPESPSTPTFTSPHTSSGPSPPGSPERPASMRRFLSRVSLNSSYNTTANTNGNNNTDDKASIFSTPTSTSSPEGRKKPKKSSWWKMAKRHSSIFPSSTSIQENMGIGNSTVHHKPSVQAIPPPPRLPDDMFGNISSLDNDMFKNFK